MVITYQGGNYFRIQSGNFTVLVDPANSRSFRGANIILNTVKPALVPYVPDFAASVGEKCTVLENQGEYEIGGIRVNAWSVGGNFKENKEYTCYAFYLEDIKVAIIGYSPGEILTAVLEKIAGADILIIPSSGAFNLNETAAVKIARQVNPSIIIPTLFEREPKKIAAELGQSPIAEEKLTLKKKELIPGAMKVVWLKT